MTLKCRKHDNDIDTYDIEYNKNQVYIKSIGRQKPMRPTAKSKLGGK
jgi:hypothetical protein